MDAHQNARTTPHSRMLIVEWPRGGWMVSTVAAAMGIDPKTVRKWRDRFAAQGEAGLQDRSSRPHGSPTRLSSEVQAEIVRLRRERLSGPSIVRQTRRPVSTVGAVLRRLGLGRLAALDPKPPALRYERERPSELVHIDTKKLGRIEGIGHRFTGHRVGMVKNRGIGWDHPLVAVGDASRLAYTEILPDDRKESATGFLT
ncbi:leucine zipper domain-containing protein [Methylobacterium durans]|uniref:helix-turn-helix domain-containing protein n=1 Tax=Methylobacterium durans TaxID=2202825 RepID=UPI002AFE8FCE|nr:leucine zipper domain-containing protein [Methylobacterium durans]MEA1835258.1 leucine zipper domain-containing protein [Methylobacterium durans]